MVGFAWSKWSSEVGEQQFVVKACECMNQEEVSRENQDLTCVTIIDGPKP